MKTKTKLILRAGLALLAASVSATWCLLAASNAQPVVDPAKGAVTNAPAVTPFMDIASAGPLNHVWIGNELSCQVQHVADGNTHEFYPPGTIPGDCGTFIAMGGTLYAPDFANHGGTATGNLGTYTVFTPVSQSPVTGTGTPADPFRVVTVVNVATTGLHIQQTDSYVIGDESYRTDIMISNTGAAATGILFRAADSFLQGSDSGYGFVEVSGNRTSVGTSANPNNIPPGRIEEWVPLTDNNNYYEAFYGEIWHWIGTKVAFPNMCGCTTLQDNGAGISWNFSIPAEATVTYSHLTRFSPTGGATPTPTPTPTPTASVAPQEAYVTVSKSSVKKGQQAAFIVALDPGPAAQPITVFYSMSGSASLGTDYTLSGTPGQVTIPAGSSSANVILRARKNVNKAATMTLINGPGYFLSGFADDVATIRIKKK